MALPHGIWKFIEASLEDICLTCVNDKNFLHYRYKDTYLLDWLLFLSL